MFMLVFLFPIYAFATPDIDNIESNTSNIYDESVSLIPLNITNASSDASFISSGTERNQINEIAEVRWNDEHQKYEITLRIGSYSMLDYVAVLNPEYVDDLIETPTDFSELPAAENTFPSAGEYETTYNRLVDSGMISQEMNQYYYVLDNGLKKSQSFSDENIEVGTISFEVSNLSEPIYIKTYSSLFNTSIGNEKIISQIVRFNEEYSDTYHDYENNETAYGFC